MTQADFVGTWDRTLFFLINSTWRHPLLDLLLPFITNKWNFILPLAAGVVCFLATGGKPARLVVLSAIVVLLLADTSATALRSFFHRARPCQALEGVRLLVGCTDSFSFPSNHATNVFALAAFFGCYYRPLLIPLLVMAALVAYSRVYVGVHYPLDVLGGAALGIACGLAIGKVTRVLLRSRAG